MPEDITCGYKRLVEKFSSINLTSMKRRKGRENLFYFEDLIGFQVEGDTVRNRRKKKEKSSIYIVVGKVIASSLAAKNK